MPHLGAEWSEQRRMHAQRFPAMLYGVIAILTAELAVQPGEFDYLEAGIGALLVGLAMMLTRIVVEVVKKEAEIGSHLPLSKAGAICGDSTLVMVFPALTTLLIFAGAIATSGWQIILDTVLYVGTVFIFLVGFMSRYILDREALPAVLRGVLWLALSLILVAAKKFTA